MELKKLKHVHLTGIKGVGMTSLALCLQDMGLKLTGSDTNELFVTDDVLTQRGIKWFHSFSKNNISGKVDLVITTGAHGGLNNPECLYAKSKGIPIITHAQALGLLSKGKDTIAVCGVGGKTTTSSMIANMLSLSKINPSFAIGVGSIFPLGMAGKYNRDGKSFVCEADEFAVSPGVDNRPRFSFLKPKYLVVTNIEHDHPDIYPKISDTLKVYKEFFEKIPKSGFLIACIDNQYVCGVIKNLKIPIITYGFNSTADWVIADYSIRNKEVSFVLTNKNRDKYKLGLKVPGKYNAQNATAAFIVGKLLGINDEKIIEGIMNFVGTRRRFETIGINKAGVLIIDDYAHHPEEIKSVIKATREWFPEKKIIAVFQPHTYSRTKALFNDFAKSFNNADKVILMDIYSSARERANPQVSSKKLAIKIKKYFKDVHYTGGHKETIKWLKENTRKNDIILTLGAGDIFYLHKDLMS